VSGVELSVYPLGIAGTPEGIATGPPDDHARIRAALRDLGGIAARVYLVDMEPGGEDACLRLAERYRTEGILDHVVVGCLRDTYERDRWTELVRDLVARHGDVMRSLQITNEPNLSFMDGSKPFVLDALIDGVRAARAELRRRETTLAVGFGSVPLSEVALPTFWPDLRAAAGRGFEDEVDFVGHNFYIDVFEPPVPLEEIPGRVRAVLDDLRHRDLPAAGLSDALPIRVTENGWPTGTNPLTGEHRSEARQAHVLESIIDTVESIAGELNVTHYTLFGLRDADTAQRGLFHHFGILRSDLTPKPAYAAFRERARGTGRSARPSM
jgi:hypothetical protein